MVGASHPDRLSAQEPPGGSQPASKTAPAVRPCCVTRAQVLSLGGQSPHGPPRGTCAEGDGLRRASLYLHFGGEDG